MQAKRIESQACLGQEEIILLAHAEPSKVRIRGIICIYLITENAGPEHDIAIH